MLDLLTILIPWTPALAALVIGVLGLRPSLHWLAAPVCVLSIAYGLVLTLILWWHLGTAGMQVTFFEWIHVGEALKIDFAYYMDPLTMIMLCVITGIGSLIAIYAAGYMKGDPGYWRFFAYVALFIFAMTTLVMADNLVLLFLGWEGVGLCSYLLIGYYYGKPVAVAAAKKAFIVNRIGDFGFLLGIFLVYQRYGDMSLSSILIEARQLEHGGEHVATADLWIPFLLMIGAFGKSAQLPLYVWLPDAMAGPTPVSALVHAATMVTAGVYLVVRCLPLFELSPYALPTVAVVGGVTALFAATIAMCSNDLKGVFAYSTVSQLGYMFVGVGALSAGGAMFHLFTHAFFKALLFLTAGSVMHALAGQLDIRTMSGMRRKMPVTCWLMFAGCLSLAGFPFITSGFWSKDLILVKSLELGLDNHPLYIFVTVLGVITALLTAYYSFRLWFRVFMGPERFEMGDEHHGYAHGEHPLSHQEAGEAEAEGHEQHAEHHETDGDHHHEPHEMPWAMNLPLLLLAIGSLVLGYVAHHWHWFETITSYALGAMKPHHGEEHHAHIMGMTAHSFMVILSSTLAVCGIALAAYFHWIHRAAADKAARQLRPIVTLLQNKYYVDEVYGVLIVKPLRGLGRLFFIVDTMIIDGVVYFVAALPSLVGRGVRPSQSGRIQAYGLGMAMGIAAFALFIFMVLSD